MSAGQPTGGAANRLAQRLREAREFLNVSQQFVAEQTGIPRSAISDIERGARRVESLELKRLAALYRMPLSHFLEEDSAEIASATSDPTVQVLARAASEMDEDGKQQLVRFAMFLQNFDRKPDKPE
jgi:transcriptional regulator with XRE-family HTH domain